MASSEHHLDFGPHVWRGRAGGSAHAVLPTGFDALDRRLSGGWPLGAITEIFVDRYGIGELSLLMPALAGLSRRDGIESGRDGWIVWVAPPWVPYAPALTRCGVDLRRILLVESSADAAAAEANENALWATEQALRSGASDAVLAWLESASDAVMRRLQLAAEEQRSVLVLFRPGAAVRQRSPAALRLRLSAAGAKLRIEVLKCRGGRPGEICLDLAAAAGAVPAGEPGTGEAGCR